MEQTGSILQTQWSEGQREECIKIPRALWVLEGYFNHQITHPSREHLQNIQYKHTQIIFLLQRRNASAVFQRKEELV